MAGIQALQKLIEDTFKILDLAKDLGDQAWEFSGNTLTIHDANLAKVIHEVIEKADAAVLRQEAADLRPSEVLRLVARVPDLLRKLLEP